MYEYDSSIASRLSDLEKRLKPLSDTYRLDAQVLLASILDKPRSWLLSHCDTSLRPTQIVDLEAAALRLESGEPLPYVLGHWEFYGRQFQVSPDVLIPRPETELLVELALAWLRTQPVERYVADIGTGSGCIAVTLAAEVPDILLTASDVSQPALVIAKSNARLHGVEERIKFLRADLLNFDPSSPFDLICANLPYIPTMTLASLEVGKNEPLLALDGGSDGLDLIRSLLTQSVSHIGQNGRLLLEIEASQATAVLDFSHTLFPEAERQIYTDLAGHDRVVAIQL